LTSYKNIIKGYGYKWLDFNNDGYLDLIVLYYDQNNHSRKLYLYKNTGPPYFNFTHILTYNNSHGATSTDVNNNGKEDIIILADNYGNRIYENRYADSGTFVLDSLSMNSTIQMSSGYWDVYPVDANKDGFMDVTIKYFNNSEFSILYGGMQKPILQPKQIFTNLWSYLHLQHIQPADFNGNGLFDIIYNSNKIYELTGDTAIYIDSINMGYYYNSEITAAFDYDNDGDIDLIRGQSNISYLLKNNGNSGFTPDTVYNGIYFNYPIIGDFDNDKDLDMLANSTIYKNVATPPNTPPTAPKVMWTTMDSTKVIFHWQPATDVETPQATLSYNLMVGTTSKGIDITSPLADTVTGFRRVVELGNAQLNNFYILDKSIFNLGDTIYWSVQTIDNGFGYSTFSKENIIIVHQFINIEEITLCSNIDSLFWKGNYYDSAGLYYISNGISGIYDSTFFLQLDTAPAYLHQQHIDLCTGQSYPWHGQTYYNSGTYQIYNTTTHGCDSIHRLVLKVYPDFTNIQSADLCAGDSMAFGNRWLKNSGIYDDSLVSVFSCDSVVRLKLSVSPADTMVTKQGDSLIASSGTASIRW